MLSPELTIILQESYKRHEQILGSFENQCIITLHVGPTKTFPTRMWDNAQRDGRLAEYRWRRLFNVAVWLTPTTRLPCSNASKTRNALKFAGMPQTPEPISAVSWKSSPYYDDMWRRYWCLTSFFPIVDTCLSCEDTAQQSCVMVPRWRFFASCISSEPHAAHFRPAF